MAIYDKYSLNYSSPITVNDDAHQINLPLALATVPDYVLIGKVYYLQAGEQMPVGGARIRIVAIPTYSTTIYPDNNGYYHVQLPNTGPFSITVSANGFVTIRATVSIPIKVPIIKDFHLSPNPSYGNTIYGILSDAESPNTPINNANLYISSITDAGTIIKATTSVTNGEYSLYDLADGSYMIRAYADGYNAKTETTAPLSSALKLEKNIQLTRM